MHSRLRGLFRLLYELVVLSSSTPPFQLWHLVSGETTCFLRHLASTQLYPGSLAASTSNFSMTNVSSIMPESFSFTRAAPSAKLACLLSSFGKTSKTPNVVGPRRNAYQAIDPGCFWTADSASWR